MEPLYQKIELKKPGFFQRLLNSEPKENAIAEINNLLASKPVPEITNEEIEEIAIRYNVDFYKKYSDQLKELYTTYLKSCLEDHKLTETEITELHHLKNILSLKESDISIIHNNIAGEIYKKTFTEIIKDGRLDKQEEESLKELQKRLLLPDNIEKKISADCRQKFVNNYFQMAIADKRLSDAELAEFEAISNSLQAQVNFDQATKEQLEKFKLYWIIENGKLPKQNVDLNLQKNETCFFHSKCEYLEQRTVTKSIRYGGPSVSIKIMKGLYYRTGSYSVQKVTTDQVQKIDNGIIYITNKRVIFVGNKKNSSIKLDKILSFTPYSNGIEIAKETGRNPIFIVESDADILGMILSRVLNDN